MDEIMNKTLSSSILFKKKWIAHFAHDVRLFNFNFIEGLSFTKKKYLPIYQSIGGSLLMSSNQYSLKHILDNSFKKKLALIYNLPTYQQTLSDAFLFENNLKIKKIKEYEAYLADFSQYETINEYFTKQVGHKKIGNIKRRKNKLEKCFSISYKLLYKTNLSENLYASLMSNFKKLLIEKFKTKKELYTLTDDYLWCFYTDVILPMISSGEASLFIVYNNEKPISFYLCYHFDSVVLGIVPVFDIDYSKFGLGSITIMKLFEELSLKGIKMFDFYKGEYGYKKDWCNQSYNYEHHIIYDKSSFTSSMLSTFIATKFKLKQYLRQKGLNDFYYKIGFVLKNKQKITNRVFKATTVLITEIDEMQLEPISLLENTFSYLKKEVYDYLYLNNIHIDNIDVYQIKDDSFLIKNKIENQYIKLS